MNTTTLQTFNLRGMDERWIVDPQDALYIQDMFCTPNDSWRTSGGFSQVFDPGLPTVTIESAEQVAAGEAVADPTIVTASSYSTINSIHWFSQHNGARQWLIYEEQNFKLDESTGTPTESAPTRGWRQSTTSHEQIRKPNVYKDAISNVWRENLPCKWF